MAPARWSPGLAGRSMRWSSRGSVRSAATAADGRAVLRGLPAASCWRPRARPARAAPCRWGRGRDRTGAAPSAGGESLGFDAAVALGPYQGPIRDLCLRLKHERERLAGPLAGRPAGRGPRRRARGAMPAGRVGRAGPAALAAAVAARLQPGRGAGAAAGRSARLRLVRAAAAGPGDAPPGARWAGPSGRGCMRDAFRVRPARPRPDGPDRAAGRRHPDHRRDLRRGGPGLEAAGAARVVVVVVGRAEGKA